VRLRRAAGELRQNATLDDGQQIPICAAPGWVVRSPLSPPGPANLSQRSPHPKCAHWLGFCNVAHQENQWPFWAPKLQEERKAAEDAKPY